MAWEWVAPVVTGFVGVVGISGTYLTSRNQTQVAVKLAREARVQARREQAYLEVQRVVERSMLWADQTMPVMSAPGQEIYPPPPPNDDQTLEASAHRLYWSPEVLALVVQWTNARNALIRRSAIARQDPVDRAEAWRVVPDLKNDLSAAAEALQAQMSNELMAT